MRADHRAGAFAIQIEIANVEGFLRFFEFRGIFRVDAAGQSELGVVGDFEGVVEVPRFDHRQHRAENFFLGDARLGIDVSDDRGLRRSNHRRERDRRRGATSLLSFPTSM